MIVNDRKITNFLKAGALTLATFAGLATSARAGNADITAALDTASRTVGAGAPAAASVLTSGTSSTVGAYVTIVKDGTEYTYATTARTVRDFLAEREIRVASSDDVSPTLDEAIADGTRVVLRPTIAVTLSVDRRARVVRAAPQTVRALLAAQHVRLTAFDEVTPSPDSLLRPREIVRVTHVRVWSSHVRSRVAHGTQTRSDARLAKGTTRTIDRGRDGIRETTYRYTRRNGTVLRTIVGSRVVRPARPRVIALGNATPSLARLARTGFESAVHFAGSALHMIATAYSAGCYRCSGVTASGVRAGFGVIAVDPRVIPLGTKLFIPGYGRAVAGDTGGSILGHRVDLGMNTQAAALQFGRRPVTVYVLR